MNTDYFCRKLPLLLNSAAKKNRGKKRYKRFTLICIFSIIAFFRATFLFSAFLLTYSFV